MILNGQDKSSLDDVMHFGVKGMKWGVRKARTESSGRRPSQAQIKDARVKANLMPYDKMKKSPERVTALYMTRGEQAVAVLIGGPIGVAAIGGLAVVRQSTRKRIANG